MLKLSNRVIYGIKALYELAREHGGEPLPIREISDRHDLPIPFLEQVLHRLKQAGIVESRRGINVGYTRAHSPETITIGDAWRALEGPIALCECLLKDTAESAGRARACVTSNIYRRIGGEIEKAFDSKTIRDLASEDQKQTRAGKC